MKYSGATAKKRCLSISRHAKATPPSNTLPCRFMFMFKFMFMYMLMFKCMCMCMCVCMCMCMCMFMCMCIFVCGKSRFEMGVK